MTLWTTTRPCEGGSAMTGLATSLLCPHLAWLYKRYEFWSLHSLNHILLISLSVSSTFSTDLHLVKLHLPIYLYLSAVLSQRLVARICTIDRRTLSSSLSTDNFSVPRTWKFLMMCKRVVYSFNNELNKLFFCIHFTGWRYEPAEKGLNMTHVELNTLNSVWWLTFTECGGKYYRKKQQLAFHS